MLDFLSTLSPILQILLVCLPMLVWYTSWWLWSQRSVEPSAQDVIAIKARHPAHLRAMWKGEVDGKVLLLAAQEAVDLGVYELAWEGLDTAKYRLAQPARFSELSPIAKRVFLQGGNRPLPTLVIGTQAKRVHLTIINRLETYFQAEFRQLTYPPALVFLPGFFLMVIGFSLLMTTKFSLWQLALIFYPFLLMLLAAAMVFMGDGFQKLSGQHIRWSYGLRVCLLLGLMIIIDLNIGIWAFTPPVVLILTQMWWYQRFQPSKSAGIQRKKCLIHFRNEIKSQSSETNQWQRWALDMEVPEFIKYESLMKHTSFAGHFSGSNWMSQAHWRDIRA
ncbi:MAG: hypothetical protein AAF399_15250 [Bacteroidota bacterium]